MEKVMLIGKFDEETRKTGDCISEEYQVILCAQERGIIKGMLREETPDVIVVSLSGSAVAARDMFAFLLPLGYPVLGIGSEDNQAELFINGYLTEPGVRFLKKPAKDADILRCIQELCGQEAKSQEEEADTDSAGETEKASVLLVDDSPGFLRGMEAMLSQKYKVTFALSCAQAIAAITKHRPDIILLDYEMPVCDGRLTLKMLRSEDDMKDIPVVFLTGKSDARRVSDVIELHPEGYLLKPCAEETVFATIEKVLHGRKKQGRG